jgi:hypothetical protein
MLGDVVPAPYAFSCGPDSVAFDAGLADEGAVTGGRIAGG